MSGRGTSIIILLAAAVAVSASPLASISSGNIRFGIDTAVFDYTGGDTLGVEVYQEIEVDQLSLGSDSTAGFETLVVLVSTEGDTTALDQWFSEVQWTEGRTAVNSTVLPVVPGEYVITVIVTDAGNGRQGTVSRPLSVEPLERVSDIELARVLVAAPEGSVNSLLKGSYLVYPAASGIFMLPADHILYYYMELYRTAGELVSLQSRLENPSGAVVFARPWTQVTLPDGAGAIGLLDSLNLQVAQSSGIYRVVFELVIQGDTLEVVKPLVVGRSVETVAQTDGASADTITALLYPDQFRLILSSQERDLFDDLDDDARVRFYVSFWFERDADRAAFEQRCIESERYSRAFSEGWRTDRGRVYIIFGAPNDIEAVPLVIDQIPHEIWYYYGSGSSERFVFADRTGTGDYEQIFSTVEGETSYSNWEDMLAPVTSGSVSGGSNYQP